MRGQFVWLAALLALTGQAVAHTAPVQVRNGLAYGPRPAERGDLYLPAHSGAHRAAVVLIHGGGWVAFGRADDAAVGQQFARSGLVAFSVDYRLANAADPDTHWPAQLVDVQLAVRFLRAHAAEYGIDPARIGAMGDSAGGHLAVFLGVLQTVVPSDADGLYAGVSPAVAAVVDEYGPMDLRNLGPAVVPSIEALFGTAAPAPAALQTASPLPEVSAKSAPTYILHGRGDRLVPFSDSQHLAAALEAHGVAVRLVPFDGGHAFEGVPAPEAARLQGRAVHWLRTRLRG